MKKNYYLCLMVIASVVFISCGNNGPIILPQVDEPITASDLETTLGAITAVSSPTNNVPLSVPAITSVNITEDNIDEVGIPVTGTAGTTNNAERTGNSIRNALQIDENANFTLGTPTAEVNENNDTIATIRIPVNPNDGYALEEGLTGYTFVLTLSAGNWVKNYTLKPEDFVTSEIRVTDDSNAHILSGNILASTNNAKTYTNASSIPTGGQEFNVDLTIARIITVLSGELTPTQEALFALDGSSGITLTSGLDGFPNSGLQFNIDINLTPGVVQPSSPLAFIFTQDFPTLGGNSGQGTWVRN